MVDLMLEFSIILPVEVSSQVMVMGLVIILEPDYFQNLIHFISVFLSGIYILI